MGTMKTMLPPQPPYIHNGISGPLPRPLVNLCPFRYLDLPTGVEAKRSDGRPLSANFPFPVVRHPHGLRRVRRQRLGCTNNIDTCDCCVYHREKGTKKQPLYRKLTLDFVPHVNSWRTNIGSQAHLMRLSPPRTSTAVYQTTQFSTIRS
jgi:hypothetical protein